MPTPDGEAAVQPAALATRWREQLIDAGLLVGTGAPGVYGLTGRFEAIVTGVTAVIDRFDLDGDVEVLRFPPVMPRADFERTGYARSFPDKVGSVRHFSGQDREHASLLRAMDDEQDWSATFAPADTILCSAVCHPVYGTITSEVPLGGKRWNLYGHVFRHEASLDPARMQCFRQYEYVFVGAPEDALRHRDLWISRASELMTLLGLDASVEVANDPFFGRLGRMLAANQQEARLKYEVRCATDPDGTFQPVASANYHQDHFGRSFGLRTTGGATAHSTCVGFGVERLALALLGAHGLRPEAWPGPVRAELWGA